MTAPATTKDALDALDAFDPTAMATLEDPVAAAVRGDPHVAAHLDQSAATGTEATRRAIAQVRLDAVPEAERAAAPYVAVLAKLDEERRTGHLYQRFGAHDLAQRFFETERDAIRRDMAAAVRDAMDKVRERLNNVEASVQTAATEGPPPVLTPEQSRAMTDLLTLLPHLSPAERLAQLDEQVAAAAREPARRGALRHLLPLLRSMAEDKAAFARASDLGTRLYVAARRAEALTTDWRHAAAKAMARYAGVLRYELGVIESAVGEHGTWSDAPASRRTLSGGSSLRVAIAPDREAPAAADWNRRATGWKRAAES